MPPFELYVATALAFSAFCSLTDLYLTREKRGKIQLPTHVDDSESEENLYREDDAFNVMTREDVIDGYPIDADAFWASVSRLEMASRGSGHHMSDRCERGNVLSRYYLLSSRSLMPCF